MKEVARTIPVDSLAVSRKVMPASASTIRNKVDATIQELGLHRNADVRYREVPKVTVDLVGQDEFANHRFTHPCLGIRSVLSMADGFNSVTRQRRDGLNNYISGVPVGEALYDEIDDGKFVVGFMTNTEFRQRMLRERDEAINILLDSAGLDHDDPFREWGTVSDDNELWIPALYVATDTPDADKLLDELTSSLTERARSASVDIYDAAAKLRVVYFPVEKLSEQLR